MQKKVEVMASDKELEQQAVEVAKALWSPKLFEEVSGRYPGITSVSLVRGDSFAIQGFDEKTHALRCSVSIGSPKTARKQFETHFTRKDKGKHAGGLQPLELGQSGSGHKAEHEDGAAALKRGEPWNIVPAVKPRGSVQGALEPRQAAGLVRENAKAELISKCTPELDRAFALMHHAIDTRFYGDVGLKPPPLNEESGGLGDILSKPDERMFFLRYDGPDISIRQPAGDVELRKGNLLGYHNQRLTRLFGNSFFQTVLDLKRCGEPPENIYAGIARLANRLDPVGTMFQRGNMHVMEAVKHGLFDRLNYSDVSQLDEKALGWSTRNPNAVFLTHINLLPAVEGLGLTEPFLKQAYAHDLDSEGVKWAFAYARLGDLYRRYVPAEHQMRFRRLWVLREETSASGIRLPQEDLNWIIQFIRPGGTTNLQQHVLEKRPDGMSAYSTLRFHERAGGEVVCGIPWCSMSDFASLCSGALIIAPLQELRLQGRI